METAVSFPSDGLTLRGVLHRPDDRGAPLPAIVLCHGFGGSCRGAGHPELARTLERMGYVVLRFDFRGCGESDGARGNVICVEEVADARHAIDFLAAEIGVAQARIGVIGASLGGSVAIEVAAADPRVRACAANGAVGNFQRQFRFQYPDRTAREAFWHRVDDAKRSGRTLDRFAIVQIPEAQRAGLPQGAAMEFSADTALSLKEFIPEGVVRRIAPRPLLLLHARGDRVVPVTETEALAASAGENCEKQIIESREHFGSGSAAVATITLDWLARRLPAS